MKKAYNRFGSVFTIFLLAVFCAALLPPTTTGADLYPDPEDLLTQEARDVADEHPWVDGDGGQTSSRALGSCNILLRVTILMMDAGMRDVGGNAQTILGNTDSCERKGQYETQDSDALR